MTCYKNLYLTRCLLGNIAYFDTALAHPSSINVTYVLGYGINYCHRIKICRVVTVKIYQVVVVRAPQAHMVMSCTIVDLRPASG